MTSGTDRDELIRARAYALWDLCGRPEGDGLRFWLEAEREVDGVEPDAVSEKSHSG
ncbi:MAG: hypothetical protein JWP84_1777 [Tardiphaga sp.]|jgi:hypothetical protein|nr:hypothetical protein [Tardiphaga sp.]